MARNLFALLAGSLFGLGLMLSGMTDTAKVRGFLDVLGAWDATLIFVIVGALIPMFFAWRVAEARRRALLGNDIPARPDPAITRDLAVGSTLFGIGWGLSGLCPGPAMASLSYNGWGGLVFLAAMVVGMLAAPAVKARLMAA